MGGYGTVFPSGRRRFSNAGQRTTDFTDDADTTDQSSIIRKISIAVTPSHAAEGLGEAFFSLSLFYPCIR
jgi:hypothetical protein